MTACGPATSERGREVGKARGPRRMYYHENRIYTPTSLGPQIAVEIMLHTDSRDASRFFAVDGRAPHFEVRRPPDFSPLVGVAAAARPCPHAPRLSASRLRTASSDSPDFDGRSFGWPAGEPDGGGGFTGPLPRRSCWPLNEM